jgi:osmotically-inducible protein OsmY
MTDSNSFKYLEAHLREAIAEDERCNMLDIRITIADRRIFLMGAVESEARRLAAEAVVRERVDSDMSIVNQLSVPTYEQPKDAELVG